MSECNGPNSLQQFNRPFCQRANDDAANGENEGKWRGAERLYKAFHYGC
jgi:hypothetical protein